MDETKVEVGSEAAELEDDGSLVLAEDGEGDDGDDVMIESAEDGSVTDGADGAADENGDADGQDEGGIDDEFDFESEIAKAFAEDEDENEESEEKSAEGASDNTPGGDAEDQAAAEKKAAEPEKKEESTEARELRELKAKYEKLERRSKDALRSLGMDETDAVAGLERLAQEQSDMSPEEYKNDLKLRDDAEAKRVSDDQERERARREKIKADIAAMKKADLEAIHIAFPASKKYERVDDIPNFARYKQLRDAGNTPEEAYAAVNPAGISEGARAAEHKARLDASKSHLKSAVGRSTGAGVAIPRSEYRMIKSMLGDDVSDAEIAKYYKKVKG